MTVPKKGTARWYKYHSIKVCKEIIKIRDKETCQRCSRTSKTNQIHGSHVLSVGSWPSMCADVYNIKCLCSNCHSWWHANPLDAFKWFEETFPDRYEYLIKTRQKGLKVDWQGILDGLKDELQQLKG